MCKSDWTELNIVSTLSIFRIGGPVLPPMGGWTDAHGTCKPRYGLLTFMRLLIDDAQADSRRMLEYWIVSPVRISPIAIGTRIFNWS